MEGCMNNFCARKKGMEAKVVISLHCLRAKFSVLKRQVALRIVLIAKKLHN